MDVKKGVGLRYAQRMKTGQREEQLYRKTKGSEHHTVANTMYHHDSNSPFTIRSPAFQQRDKPVKEIR